MPNFKNIIKNSYIVVDLETTGLSPEADRIIEIAALRITDGKPDGTFSTLVDPERHINTYITQLTGISDKMVKNAPKISEAMHVFLKFIGDTPLLGHNLIRFDMCFLQNCIPIYNDCIDTLVLAQHIKKNFSGFSLGALCSHYNVVNDSAHRALSDCLATHEVYTRLKEDYFNKGGFFTMAVNCGRKQYQQNIAEKCGIGTALSVSHCDGGLIVSADGCPIGTVGRSKQREYEENEDIVQSVKTAKISEGAKGKLLLTAEVTVCG